MANNNFTNGIAEIFKSNDQTVVNKEVLNKIAEKMKDLDNLIEITVSITSSKLPSIEARISKGQGSTRIRITIRTTPRTAARTRTATRIRTATAAKAASTGHPHGDARKFYCR